MRVTVVGLGYVGLVTAACLARMGQDVRGLEIDQAKLSVLVNGGIPYFEPHLEAELESQTKAGRLTFTADPANAMEDAEIVMICVGTPSDSTGRADLRHVLDVADTIAEHVDGAPIVVLRSTVPVGTTRQLADRLNAAREQRGLAPVTVLANPEFLRTGRAIEDFLRPSRVVIGTTHVGTDEDVAVLETLYGPLEAPIVVTDASSAELVKNASNAFLATRVSFVNELAALCDATGASVDAVVEAMSSDPRIGGQFMRPGLGYGGSCLPKDVRSLITMGDDHGLEMAVARAVDRVNGEQVDRVVDRLVGALDAPIKGSRIAVLGLAFKPDTDDTRESPGIAMADRLHRAGASVVGSDPEAGPRVAQSDPWLELVDEPMAAATRADAVVIATEWPAYVTLDLGTLAEVMRGDVLVDARNAIDPAHAHAAGLRYIGIGRRPSSVDNGPAGGP